MSLVLRRELWAPLTEAAEAIGMGQRFEPLALGRADREPQVAGAVSDRRLQPAMELSRAIFLVTPPLRALRERPWREAEDIGKRDRVAFAPTGPGILPRGCHGVFRAQRRNDAAIARCVILERRLPEPRLGREQVLGSRGTGRPYSADRGRPARVGRRVMPAPCSRAPRSSPSAPPTSWPARWMRRAARISRSRAGAAVDVVVVPS